MNVRRNCPSRLKLHNGDSLEPNTKSNINTQIHAYITTNSEQPNLPAQIQDTLRYHSEIICLRVRLHGNPGAEGAEYGCHDSNHDEKDDAEDKHHPAVPVRPVALVARSFDNLVERQGYGLGMMDYFDWRHTIAMASVAGQRIAALAASFKKRGQGPSIEGCILTGYCGFVAISIDDSAI
ncbi:unnamed protein product [Penicillium viridicatum]